jgi:hypothetical protein
VPVSGKTSAVEESERASPIPADAAGLDPNSQSATPMTAQQLGDADPENEPPQAPQALKRQLQPGREQQKDDPQLGKWGNRFTVRDSHVGEPAFAAGQAAENRRPDQQPDQDEPNHRADPEAGEGRNHDPRRAQDYECVGQAVSAEFAWHGTLVPAPSFRRKRESRRLPLRFQNRSSSAILAAMASAREKERSGPQSEPEQNRIKWRHIA